MKVNELGTKYLEFDNDTDTFNIIVEGEVIKTVIGKSSAEKYSASLQRKGISAIIEADLDESIQEEEEEHQFFFVTVGTGRDSVVVKTRAKNRREAIKSQKMKYPGQNVRIKPEENPHLEEADEPKDVSARAKLDHSLRAQGHKVVPDKKKELRKGKVKHKGKIEELRDIKIDSTEHEIVVKVGDDKSYTLFIDGKKIGEYSSFGQAKKAVSKELKNESTITEGPLVLNRDSDLRNMLDTLLKGWLSQGDHSDDEYAELLKALGYRMERDGQRTTIVKEDELEEAPGAIRKGLAAVAIIASLWGVNNQLAQQAYDASPQLQKLTAYLEVAKQHNDQRMIDQLEQRIENHKARLDLGKGEVMGKDGMPIDVKYDKDVDEAKQRLDPKCWKGYKKQGTKMKGGVRVNNCVPK